LTILVAGRSG